MQILKYRMVNKPGALKYTFDLLLPEFKNMIIFGMKYFKTDKSAWVDYPSKEYINKEGEKKYACDVGFQDAETFKEYKILARKVFEKHLEESPKEDVPF